MDTREALITLNMAEHVGPVRVRRLLEHFGDAPSVLKATASQLTQVKGIGGEAAASISDWEKRTDLSGELKRIKDFGCHVITADDEEYPDLLKEIYDPPIVLYVKGSLTAMDHRGVAMVGSRQTTLYGMETAKRMAKDLAARGVTVVSGGARGIDTAAHQGALKSGGRTVAVLGTGINLVAPAENARLLNEISESGAVVSQFPFNRKGDRQSFPIRNRIVAGMTLGTIVVEANQSSGALITANMAADYSRQVFAIPGRIDSPRSKGCHDLIKKGAALIDSAEDVIEELSLQLPNSVSEPETDEPALPLNDALPENEKRIYDLLEAQELSMDDIMLQTDLTTPVASVALLNLEMKRLVKQMPGRIFMRA